MSSTDTEPVTDDADADLEVEETGDVEDEEDDEYGFDDAGRPDPVELEFAPTKLSSGIAVAAAAVAAMLSAPYTGLALPFSLTGLLFVAVGLYRTHSRRWLSFGVVSLFLGIIAADMFSTVGPMMPLASMMATLVCWDVGQNAITIGEQFGRTSPTRRGELVHASGSVMVGVLASGFAFGVYVLGQGGQPTLAVGGLLFGAVLVVWALRD